VVKLLVLFGGYLYVWLLHFAPAHGPAWVFWLSCLLFSAATVLLYSMFTSQPEKQERQYLVSLLIDLLALAYLCFLHPPMLLLLLIGLVIVCGFYVFVLPRTSGLLVAGLALMLYLSSALTGFYAGNIGLTPRDLAAEIVVGLAGILGVALLVRKVKRGIDAVYETADSLALELSTQAIDSAIAVEVMTERNREVQTLLQILQNIGSILEWDELFESIVQAFRNRFSFDKFSIYLYDKEQNQLALRVESGSDRATGAAKTVNPGQGIVGWCFEHAKPVLLDDVREDLRYTQFNERGKRIRSLASLPLVFRAERLGVLCLDSERVAAFDAKSFMFLESMAPLIANAVVNSISYTEVKTESFTDNLTGLYNHRGFMDKFLPLLQDAFTDEFPLAVIMIDIDDFKKVNDTYGHLVGNLILTDLSDILQSFFRGSDLVGRYGGEEFIVVLNNTPSDIAPRIAEQLRRKIEAHQFPISLQRDTFKQVTISMGVSCTGDSNLAVEIVRGSRLRGEPDVYLRNLDELAAQMIDNADQALYAAKREGKNVVMLSHHYQMPQQPALDQAPEC
jgi:diguanylate cyclase (GGDEF)-like protein